MNPNNFSRQEVEKYYGTRLPRLRSTARGQATAPCAFHPDDTPSLSINLDTGQWKCHAGCGAGSVFDFEMRLCNIDFGEARVRVLEAIGRPLPPQVAAARRTIATYQYFDEQNQLLYEVLRYEPKGFAKGVRMEKAVRYGI